MSEAEDNYIHHLETELAEANARAEAAEKKVADLKQELANTQMAAGNQIENYVIATDDLKHQRAKLNAQIEQLKGQFGWRGWSQPPKHGDLILITSSQRSSNPTIAWFTNDPIAGREIHYKDVSYAMSYYDLWAPIPPTDLGGDV